MPTATMSVPPHQSRDQRIDNLRKANRIRTQRAEIKKELKRGERTLEEIFCDIPDSLETMRVFDLLVCCPKIGKTKANNICRRLDIRPSLYLPQLSDRRRQQLVLAIGGYLPSRAPLRSSTG